MLNLFQKSLGCLRKSLVFFPHHMHACSFLRGQGAEAEAAVTSGIDKTVQGQSTCKTFLHHKRSIIDKVVGADDIHLVEILFKPARELVVGRGLSGSQEGKAPQVFRVDLAALCERMVLSHQQPPDINSRDADIIVIPDI